MFPAARTGRPAASPLTSNSESYELLTRLSGHRIARSDTIFYVKFYRFPDIRHNLVPRGSLRYAAGQGGNQSDVFSIRFLFEDDGVAHLLQQ